MEKMPLSDYIYNVIKKKSSYGYPALIHPSQFAEKYECSNHAVSQSISRMVKKGIIQRVDEDGNPLKREYNLTEQLIALVREKGGTIPWARKDRAEVAKRLGCSSDSIKSLIYRSKDCLYISENQLHVKDGVYSDAPTCRISAARSVFYVPVKEKEPPKKKNKKQKNIYIRSYHHIINFLLQNKGEFIGNLKQLSQAIGLKHTTVTGAVRRTEMAGVLGKINGRVFIKDYKKARKLFDGLYFLGDDFNIHEFRQRDDNHLPLCIPSLHEVVSGNKAKGNVCLTVVKHTEILRETVNAPRTLILLYLLEKRQKLLDDIRLIMVRYPMKYGKWKEMVAMKYREIVNIDEALSKYSTSAKNKNYHFWNLQKGIAVRLIEAVKHQFGLSGIASKESVKEVVKQLSSMMPTETSPENPTAEELVEYLESGIAEDRLGSALISNFIETTNCTTVPDFLKRGGFEYAAYINVKNTLRGKQYHRYVFHLLVINGYYANNSEKDPSKLYSPDYMFMNNVLDRLEGDPNTALSVGNALMTYVAKGFSLKCIEDIAKKVIPMLKKEEILLLGARREPTIATAWDLLMRFCSQNFEEEYRVLSKWGEKFSAGDYGTSPTIMKFSLEWYRKKLESAQKYGLPGDASALIEKINAILRWNTVGEKEKQKLVGLLNKPTRYDNPLMEFDDWEIVINGISREENVSTKENTADEEECYYDDEIFDESYLESIEELEENIENPIICKECGYKSAWFRKPGVCPNCEGFHGNKDEY